MLWIKNGLSILENIDLEFNDILFDATKQS